MTEALHDYAVAHSPAPGVMAEIARETEALGDVAVMQMAPEQGALTSLLVRAIGAASALEIGAFTGYGTVSIARGLAPGGRLIACEVSEEYAEIVRRTAERAGVAEQVEVRVGPALDTLRAMTTENSVDFAFIDADKPGYPAYYEEVVRLLRPGGVAMVDNVFRGGAVLDPGADDESTRAIRELNDRIAGDERVQSAMIGVADGITLVLKL